MKKIIFFDLDGTLTNEPSCEQDLLQYLVTNGFFGVKQITNILWFLLRYAYKYKHFVFIKNKCYLTGLSHDEMKHHAKIIAHDKIIPRLRPCLIKCIEEHRKAGDINVLLTGAHEFIADIIGQHLKMDAVIGTKCVIKDNKFTAAPPAQHPFHYEKLLLAEKACQQYNTSLDNCVAYGNSINDQFILKGVGRPIAVTPDRSLRKIAMDSKWEIIDV